MQFRSRKHHRTDLSWEHSQEDKAQWKKLGFFFRKSARLLTAARFLCLRERQCCQMFCFDIAKNANIFLVTDRKSEPLLRPDAKDHSKVDKKKDKAKSPIKTKESNKNSLVLDGFLQHNGAVGLKAWLMMIIWSIVVHY